MNKFYSILPLMVLCVSSVLGKNNLTKDEQQIKIYLTQNPIKLDTNANAVYLNEYSKVIATYSDRNFFYEFKVEKIAKIFNEAGKDISEVKIDLKMKQDIVNVEAITYNLTVDNQVQEEVSKEPYQIINRNNQRFAVLDFKNVKKGSVIYYKYTLRASGDPILPIWQIQEKYPKVHSKLEMALERGMELAVYDNKAVPFNVVGANELNNCNACKYIYANDMELVQFRTTVWSRNNIEAIKTILPSFQIGSGENVRIQLEHLSNTKYQYRSNGNVYGTTNRAYEHLRDIHLNKWDEVNEKLLFGNPGFEMKPNNNLMKKKLYLLIKDTDPEIIKAKSIFSFVRDSISLIASSESIFFNDNLDEVLKNKRGTQTEKNLLLVAMLRAAALSADPVVLIKRDHEALSPDFANYSSLDYCVALLNYENIKYFIDASEVGTPFGMLLPGCYDKVGLLVSESLNFIPLPQTPKELITTLVNVDEIKNSDEMNISVKVKMSKLCSVDLRNYITQRGLRIDENRNVKKFVGEYLGLDITADLFQNFKIEQLYNVDSPVIFEYSGNLKRSYVFSMKGFDPFIVKVMNSIGQANYGSANMPYEIVYILNMNIPSEYSIDKLPESKNIALVDNAITYFSFAKYDANEKSLKLTYRYRDNGKNLERFKKDDLDSFFKSIEYNQTERIY